MQKIETVEDNATPWLRELAGRVTPHRIATEAGPRGTRLVQRNFRSLGRNERGWPSTQFYGRAAEATNWQEGAGFFVIAVNQIGVRQRLLGGDIKPVKAGALTIPAIPQTYGKTAREFPNLEFGFLLDPETGRMRPCLKEKAESRKQKRGNGKAAAVTTGQVAFFWLSKGVHQDPDPRVMPSDADFEAEFDKSVEALLK